MCVGWRVNQHKCQTAVFMMIANPDMISRIVIKADIRKIWQNMHYISCYAQIYVHNKYKCSYGQGQN